MESQCTEATAPDESRGTTIYFTKKKDDPFARVPKDMLDDLKLSWKAKGILSYLLGKKADWKVRITDLVKKSTDGKASIRSALLELRKAGYARLEPIRVEGKLVKWQFHVSDSPCLPPEDWQRDHKETDDLPEVDLPDPENQDLENQHLSKNRLGTKNEITKNDLKSTTANADGSLKESGVAAKKQKEAHPDYASFVKLWFDEYLMEYGHKYLFDGGRDGKAVNKLLAFGVPYLELIEIATKAWKLRNTRGKFNCTRTTTIHGFADVLSALRGELNNAVPMNDYREKENRERIPINVLDFSKKL